MINYRGWAVVAGSFFALGFSIPMLIASSYTILAAAIGSDLGWSRADLALGATLFFLGQVPGYPVAGLLVDRFGALRVGVGATLLLAGLLYSLSEVDAVWQLQSLLLLMGLLAPSGYTPVYMRVVSQWFVARRGLALGLAAAGVGLGSVFYPLGVERLIAAGGWESTLVVLTVLLTCVCIPIVLLTIRDVSKSAPPLDDAETPGAAGELSNRVDVESGLTAIQAFRTADFWLIAGVFMVTGVAQYGLVTNAAYILSETASLNLAEVAMAQSVIGVSLILGRIVGGYLLDRFNPRVVAVGFALSIALGIFGYAIASSIEFVLAVAFVIGFASGGEADVLPYMVARYFGHRAFGKVYGLLGAIFAIGAGIGPLGYLWLIEATDGVRPALFVIASLMALASFGFAFVGRREFREQASC